MRLLLLVALLTACGPAPTPMTPVPRPRPRALVALPGTCLDPQRDALDRLGPDADREGLREERSSDLDGDGAADPFITHSAFCGSGGCTWHIYVTRDKCAHYVGELFGVLPIVRARTDKGLAELEITARTGCAGMARTETRARFDGQVYAAYSARKCRCPDPAEDASKEPDPEALCDDWRAVAPTTP